MPTQVATTRPSGSPRNLDFTVVDGGPEEPEELQHIFTEVDEWLREESGIELVLDTRAFTRRPKQARPSHHSGAESHTAARTRRAARCPR